MGLISSIKDVASNITPRKNPSQTSDAKNYYRPAGEEEPEQPVTTSQGAEPQKTQTQNSAPVLKLTVDEAKNTGTAKAYLYTSIIEMVRSFAVTYKHKKCLTDKEKQIKNIAIGKNPSQLSTEEVSVLQKYSKACEKFEKQKDRIRTKESMMKMLEEAYALNAQITGKKASPNLIIGSAWVKFGNEILQDFLLD